MDYKTTLDPFRPVPFYFLTTTDPADYTSSAVYEAMKRMKEQGFGGIVLFNKPPHGFDSHTYLSDYWFEVTGYFIEAARKLNLQLWINDGFNYPPGDAAGRIEAVNPALKQHRLRSNPEGKLDVVEVPWGFPAFEEPESSELFIKFVYEQYYQRFAPYFGNGITGFFSDADNRRVNAFVLKELDERYYPWSTHFSALFEKRFNYRIEDNLKALFNNSDEKVVQDYWLLAGELYQQWFANNYRWCKEHNVLYTFHSSDTGPLRYSDCGRSSLFSEGKPLTLLEHSDAPGTDHEIFVLDGGTHYDKRFYGAKVSYAAKPDGMLHPEFSSTLKDIRAKYAGSAAYLGNKDRCMCEMFAATNWGATFNDLRRIAAWQIMQGVNFIVPHAVHHRFRGVTKFFAPPEFSHTTLAAGIRQFNDMLARYCQAASAGELIAEYAVVDPSVKVWSDHDPAPFFELCDKLNRRSDGYVIVPAGYNGKIKKILDPMKEFPVLPEPEIVFSGGELCWMKRKLEETEYLLCANIWSSTPLEGTLKFQNKNYEIVLDPGEIAVIGGPFESFRSPEKRSVKKVFSGSFPVVWHEEQKISFEKELVFTAQDTLDMTLLVPADKSAGVLLNGRKLQAGKPVKVFDDDYCAFEFASSPGKNTVVLDEAALFAIPAMLSGNFDVASVTRNDYFKKVFYEYHLSIYEPEDRQITLLPRRKEIAFDCGWEQQGQLFYSGEAEINLGTVEISCGDRLELPGFRDIAELLIDGKSAGRSGLAPYVFELPAGCHELRLRCWNMMANRMERYAAPSGLTQLPEITSPA